MECQSCLKVREEWQSVDVFDPLINIVLLFCHPFNEIGVTIYRQVINRTGRMCVCVCVRVRACVCVWACLYEQRTCVKRVYSKYGAYAYIFYVVCLPSVNCKHITVSAISLLAVTSVNSLLYPPYCQVSTHGHHQPPG